MSHTQRHVNSTNGGGFESNHVSDTGTGTIRQSDWRAFNATKRRSSDHHHQRPSSGTQTDATWRAPGSAVNTHNMGGRFVESVKNARWLMSLQEETRKRANGKDDKIELIKRLSQSKTLVPTPFIFFLQLLGSSIKI